MERLLQGFASCFDTLRIAGRKSRANADNFRFQLTLQLLTDPLIKLSDALLRSIGHAIGQVALLDLFFATFILSSVRLSIAQHSVDLVLRETAGRGNGDLLFAP